LMPLIIDPGLAAVASHVHAQTPLAGSVRRLLKHGNSDIASVRRIDQVARQCANALGAGSKLRLTQVWAVVLVNST